MGDTQDLGLILDSGIPIVAIESPDERRVLSLLLSLAMKRGLQFSEWTLTRGLRAGGLDTTTTNNTELAEPEAMLAHIANQSGAGIYAAPVV